MLDIYYKDANGNIMVVGWIAGTPSPFRAAPAMVWNVGEIKASGHELAVIQNHFKNIPHVSNTEVRWFGDFAKFIAGNLP